MTRSNLRVPWYRSAIRVLQVSEKEMTYHRAYSMYITHRDMAMAAE